MTTDGGRATAEFLAGFARPFAHLADRPEDAVYLARLSGWDLSSSGLDPQTLAALAASFVTVLEELDSQPAGSELGIEVLLSVLPRLASAVDALAAFGTGAPLQPAAPANLAGQFVEDLLSGILVHNLSGFHPALRSSLEVLGILAYRSRAEIRLGPALVRPAQGRAHIDFALIGRLFTEPGLVLLERCGLTAGTTGSAATIARRCFPLWAALLRDLGVQAWFGGLQFPASLLSADQTAALERTLLVRLPFDGSAGGGGTAWLSIALTLFDLPGGGVELVIAPQGSLSLSRRIGDWSLALAATGNVEAVSITRSAVGFASGSGSLGLQASFGRPSGAAPLFRIGAPDGPHFEVGTISLQGGLALSTRRPRPSGSFRIAIDGLALKGAAAPGDGFLGKILPPEGFAAVCDLALEWDGQGPLRFSGAAGLDLALPLNIPLGPIGVSRFRLAVRAGSEGLTAAASSNVSFRIGPISGLVEDIGLQAALRPGGQAGIPVPTCGFKPPAGLGLKIDTGPVSGGGYLFFDPASEQYSGIVQLKIKKKIALNAIGLLTTRLPGLPPGQNGFSLLLIITAEFPPLPLGFGFTLNGIGGLIGINRTMMLEPLRNSVRDRSIEGILFPQNPLSNAASLVASLQRIFPPAEGRYVFGPMVKVGWGPTQLITIEAALILELPSPLRLVLLGRMRAVLPDKVAPVVDLRLDVVGVLDFDRGEASIDASFVDSSLAGFTLTGDMALRLGWGATKAFALAAGGFNPRFTPPPSFPVLRRLTLSLANSDNPRFRLESYLALTSNTIQFGARAELSAKVQTAIGEFGAAAMIFFDALIELDPFGFIVDLGAVIEVTLSGRPLIQAQLMATLSGTKPWHAVGFVEVVFLGRHRIPFEARVGDQEPTTLPTINVLDKLIEEVQRPESWSTVPPAEAADVVVLKDSSASGAVLLHPLGTVALRQRLLPFGKRIARFGSAVPEGGAVMFALTGIEVGGRMDAVTPLLDDFAPGQYEALSEDEKLSRPAFERMQAGVAAAASRELRLPHARPGTTMRGTQASIDYEEVVIDRVARPSRRPRRRKKPVMAIGLVAAMADDGVASDLVFTGPVDRAIAVPGERWREADADHLGALPGARAGSAAEAYDRRALSRRPADQTTVIALHEAA